MFTIKSDPILFSEDNEKTESKLDHWHHENVISASSTFILFLYSRLNNRSKQKVQNKNQSISEICPLLRHPALWNLEEFVVSRDLIIKMKLDAAMQLWFAYETLVQVMKVQEPTTLVKTWKKTYLPLFSWTAVSDRMNYWLQKPPVPMRIEKHRGSPRNDSWFSYICVHEMSRQL